MTTNKTEAILKLSRQIFELEAQEQEIHEKREARLRELTKLTEASGNGAKPQAGYPDRVYAYIVEHAHDDFDAPEVTKGIGEPPEKIRLVSSTLFRLAKAKRISKKGWGRYTALREVRTGARES